MLRGETPLPKTTQIPPEMGPAFLGWLREATERAWHQVPEPTLVDFERAGVGGCDWRRGTRWTGGLTDRQVAEVEGRFSVHFPPDHRLLLEVLHATTPRRAGAAFIDDRRMRPAERAGFYDWLREEADVRRALAAPVEGLVFDVEHNSLWPPSWGPRPESSIGRRARVEELVAKAPGLVPVIGHRYSVAEGSNVVLSVHQADIIVYGSDLRAFLLSELHDLLEVEHDPRWMVADTSKLPFWGELTAGEFARRTSDPWP
jgi:hypothetical protein